MDKKDTIIDRIQKMVKADKPKNRMQAWMDKAWRGDWSLPPQMSALKWIHKVVSSDPHDALRAGTRVLSSVEPKITIVPLGQEEEDRNKMDRIERALLFHFKNAGRRRRASILRDIVKSALLYDEVIAQVIYLPYQIETLKTFGGDTRRLEAAQAFGPFAIVLRNPQQVHIEYSDWMPERVVLKQVLPLQEVVDFWGTNAKKLAKEAEGTDNKNKKYVTLLDYSDLEQRMVLAYLQDSDSSYFENFGDSDAIEILNEENELKFFSWIAKVGGTTLASDPAHQRIPLLYPVYQTGQWDTQNILETLIASEPIAYAAAPRIKTSGPTDDIYVTYGEALRQVHEPPGHKVEAMEPPVLDAGLWTLADRVSSRMAKSTTSRVLQDAEPASGMAFATLNLITQSGLKSLNPYKELAEQALADIFTQMLYWIDHSGDTIYAYVRPAKEELTQTVSVGSDDFDTEKLFIDVELSADVPTDRMARANAASLMTRELGLSKRTGLETTGVGDPTREVELRENELDEETKRQIKRMEKVEQAKIDLQIAARKQMAQADMEIAAEQQRLQQRVEATTPGKLNQMMRGRGVEARQTGQGFENTRNQAGFNPAMQGTPPAMANPEGTREEQQKTQGTQTSIAEGV